MPKFNVMPLNAYDITKISFYTKSKDNRSIIQNRGVMVGVKSMYFSIYNDKNHVLISRA